MGSKKSGLLEKFSSVLSSKRKVISVFCIGVAISVFVFIIFFSNNPFTNFDGTIINNYSDSSWPFLFSTTTTHSSELQNSTETTEKKTNYVESNLQSTHELNLTEKDKNSIFFVHTSGELSVLDKTHEKNSSVFVLTDQNINLAGDDDDTEKRVSERTQRILFPGKDKFPRYVDVDDLSNCDIFEGKWVKFDEENSTYYPVSSCPYIDKDFDCHLNGRPDYDFLKWRWQPSGCNIPRLNAIDFLERMRGKRLVFVGDSLNRNMWESLVCILRYSIIDKSRVFEISGKTEFKKKGVYSFRYEDYNCSIDFVNAPFLVRQSYVEGKIGSTETLRLDLIDQVSSVYYDADIIVFNSGHWWTHDKTSKGENYYQEGSHVYPKLQAIEAYNKALSTWARWIDKNIDVNRTQVLFRGYSVTHFRGGQWNSGGQCHKETEPILFETYLEKYPTKMEVLESVLQRMHTPVLYLNISKLTDYRKDAHPSIYRKEYHTAEEKVAAEMSQDCSHWCLPGVPDTWNELLYASLLKAGISSWKI